MTYRDGWRAINLDMPDRIPHVEFDADMHWALVRRVTGLSVNAHSPVETKNKARESFVSVWNYDLLPANLIGHETLSAKRTYMGHAEYEDAGLDFDDHIDCPFTDVEEVYAFDPWETYGEPDRNRLVDRYNAHYHGLQKRFPETVATTGVYITLFSGMIAIFGWELLLTAGGLYPDRFGEVVNRYAGWMMHYYDAVAESDAPVIWSHDDIVWAAGPVFRPAWYRKYIFPNYEKYYAPLLAAGKKVIFVSDGNYTPFVDDIAAVGASGFFFEPLTDLAYVVENYGQSHIIIGNADTRILLTGTREAIKREVERCLNLGRPCPGYFMGVTNMIPANTPIENALYYNEVYQSLSRR
ncbi:MAG: uroporphyrinogen decarboxylase family protein [Anaerolineae bacterium]|nr:uroporphyrinogen decarboxylase family protein [Anaerolineae bacterium]